MLRLPAPAALSGSSPAACAATLLSLDLHARRPPVHCKLFGLPCAPRAGSLLLIAVRLLGPSCPSGLVAHNSRCRSLEPRSPGALPPFSAELPGLGLHLAQGLALLGASLARIGRPPGVVARCLRCRQLVPSFWPCLARRVMPRLCSSALPLAPSSSPGEASSLVGARTSAVRPRPPAASQPVHRRAFQPCLVLSQSLAEARPSRAYRPLLSVRLHHLPSAAYRRRSLLRAARYELDAKLLGAVPLLLRPRLHAHLPVLPVRSRLPVASALGPVRQ